MRLGTATSFLGRLRGRLSDERGFTLIELLVAVTVGMVVIIAATDMMDASGRAATETLDRVDGVQRGRGAMEQVTQRLRSQVCPAEGVAPILYGDADEVTFYADLSSRPDGAFSPEVRRLSIAPSAQPDEHDVLGEDIWEWQPAYPAPPGTQATPSYAAALATKNASVAQDRTSRILLTNVAPITDTAGVDQPVFRYYGFDNSNPAVADRELPVPLDATTRDEVVRITVSFDTRPTRGDVGAGQARNVRSELDSRFENSVFVRSADPTQGGRDPSACY